MASYDVFSEFYDELTKNVNYKDKADYLECLFKKYKHEPKLLLDLACGTGSLTLELHNRAYDIYGVDASAAMLSIAKEKAYDMDVSMLYLCQKMQNLDLYGTVDTVICMLDGINHLPAGFDVQKTFDKVSLFLEPGGYFIFDFNTVYKHKHVLSNNTYIYDVENVYCVWQNIYEEVGDKVKIYLDFFSKMESGKYERSCESFSEITFPLKEVEQMLVNSGFKLIDIFEDMSFNEVSDNTEKAMFIAQKI